MNKVISNHTGGRLANQLYYVLQAFVQSRRNGIDCRYAMTHTFNRATDIVALKDELNISAYVANDSSHIDEIQPFNMYYQEFDKDFTEDELNEFVDETLSQANLVKQHFEENKMKDDVAALHVRNGDYKGLQMYQCFNKEKYLKDAFSRLPNEVTKLIVFSDENAVVKDMFGSILSDHFKCVEYRDSDETAPLNDFCELSTYKNKIMWNSTFSWWTGFIASRLYADGTFICPINCWSKQTSYSRTKKEWIHI